MGYLRSLCYTDMNDSSHSGHWKPWETLDRSGRASWRRGHSQAEWEMDRDWAMQTTFYLTGLGYPATLCYSSKDVISAHRVPGPVPVAEQNRGFPQCLPSQRRKDWKHVSTNTCLKSAKCSADPHRKDHQGGG